MPKGLNRIAKIWEQAFDFLAPQYLNYLTFQSFDIESTWSKLFQKRDIYVFTIFHGVYRKCYINDVCRGKPEDTKMSLINRQSMLPKNKRWKNKQSKPHDNTSNMNNNSPGLVQDIETIPLTWITTLRELLFMLEVLSLYLVPSQESCYSC
jgi:hypothetical protein